MINRIVPGNSYEYIGQMVEVQQVIPANPGTGRCAQVALLFHHGEKTDLVPRRYFVATANEAS